MIESITNPLLELFDIPALAEVARRHGIPLIVDVSAFFPCFSVVDNIALHAPTAASLTPFALGHRTRSAVVATLSDPLTSALICTTDLGAGASFDLLTFLDPLPS